jgi:hypothetical protein
MVIHCQRICIAFGFGVNFSLGLKTKFSFTPQSGEPVALAPPSRTTLLSSDEILIQIAEVSAMLHEEQGNRERLQKERTELVEEARRRGLLRPHIGSPK